MYFCSPKMQRQRKRNIAAWVLLSVFVPMSMTMAAQESHHHHGSHAHPNDTSDVFFRHLKLNELVVTGVTGDTKLKNSTAPISIISNKDLRQTTSTNIIDAIAHQPGMAQITTGGGEVDPQIVNSVEILKGPASLMYGSDAMAGVVILHSAPTLPEGEMRANVNTEYQTNNGLFDYSLNFAGNQKGFVWDARFSDKMAHAYKNKVDGYVPGSCQDHSSRNAQGD